jgi:hypothetical protein
VAAKSGGEGVVRGQQAYFFLHRPYLVPAMVRYPRSVKIPKCFDLQKGFCSKEYPTRKRAFVEISCDNTLSRIRIRIGKNSFWIQSEQIRILNEFELKLL